MRFAGKPQDGAIQLDIAPHKDDMRRVKAIWLPRE